MYRRTNHHQTNHGDGSTVAEIEKPAGGISDQIDVFASLEGNLAPPLRTS